MIMHRILGIGLYESAEQWAVISRSCVAREVRTLPLVIHGF
jgi:hypothetical protein